ncbi:Zn-dependent hydrolase [Sphingosinicella rhizophila]|uniref:Zn-dependent hydrolase n=1 Tax=Sphingosinicella rhizophila TaxID=3050082 RepID=A0ABU3QAP4_9SPHN|nr:Zn-dependent hydrolase [Sphingosinicella sp. GR2756]MDT9600485.1 Zn-dependent hydrolase [Sphingosinicella sp. GR2756]
MSARSIDAERLLARLVRLGEVGRDDDGRLIRLAASDADKMARDLVSSWMEEAGLDIIVDRIGNVFGKWSVGDADAAPIMLGSHIDTVVNAGIYDGPYGILAALEVVTALRPVRHDLKRPIIVGAFTNEEGARYAPDMMGSLVYAGGLDLDRALATIGTDGTVLGEELARIGYAGTAAPGFVTPHAYIELHIEQGPVLESEGIAIGSVENLQGISWQKVKIEGTANHAGTTPIALRRDAGHAAARVITFLRDLMDSNSPGGVATVGSIAFEPDIINVVPGRATFTVDLRDPVESRLRDHERALAAFLDDLASQGFAVTVETLTRFEPVIFDQGLCALIDEAARERGLSVRRMTSGAGHDAQMMARICPSAMIFIPSRDGISHNPREHSDPDQIAAGADVLLDVVAKLATQ